MTLNKRLNHFNPKNEDLPKKAKKTKTVGTHGAQLSCHHVCFGFEHPGLAHLSMALTNQKMVCSSGVNFVSHVTRTPHLLYSDRLSVCRFCELHLFPGSTGKLVMLLSAFLSMLCHDLSCSGFLSF